MGGFASGQLYAYLTLVAFIMDDREERALLKDEYLHIQRVIQDFDSRAVTIKGWSVSFSLVVLAGAFISHAPIAFLVGSLSTCLFWLIEGLWKTVQYAYYDRAGKIERYFAGEVKQLIPMQVGASWYKRYKAGGKRRLLQIMCRPNVALPHVVVFGAGLLLFILCQIKVLQI
jgi:hypothetical protein